jgi:hypothetical protein
MNVKINCMMDSGAYGAWKRKETININDYIAYIKRNHDFIDTYINLDVIPGEFGYSANQAQSKISAQQSFDNYLIMREHNLDPIPVFHEDEDFDWLLKYLDAGAKYIGVAPTKSRFVKINLNWLDRVFTYLTTNKGVPIVKTHCFGTNNVRVLIRYPFTSCDSAGWTLLASSGKIYVPIYRNGNPQYLKPPVIINVTDRTDAKGNLRVQFGRFSRLEQDCIIRFVEEEVGVTMTKLRYHEIYRRQACIFYLQKIGEALKDNVIFKYRLKRL